MVTQFSINNYRVSQGSCTVSLEIKIVAYLKNCALNNTTITSSIFVHLCLQKCIFTSSLLTFLIVSSMLSILEYLLSSDFWCRNLKISNKGVDEAKN